MRDFKRLRAWQSARHLANRIYDLTASLPDDERFGLSSQMQRAAVSVGANIEEGAGRASDPDYARFLAYAGGSLNELEHLLVIARDRGFVEREPFDSMLLDLRVTRRLVVALRAALGRTPGP